MSTFNRHRRNHLHHQHSANEPFPPSALNNVIVRKSSGRWRYKVNDEFFYCGVYGWIDRISIMSFYSYIRMKTVRKEGNSVNDVPSVN